jgi:hypothetical protein
MGKKVTLSKEDNVPVSLKDLEASICDMQPGDQLEFQGDISLFVAKQHVHPLVSLCGKINCFYRGRINDNYGYIFVKQDSELYGGGFVEIEADPSPSGKGVQLLSDGARLIFRNEAINTEIHILPISRNQTINRYSSLLR